MYYTQYTTQNRHTWEQNLINCYKAVFTAAPWNEDWWTDDLVKEVLDRYAGENARIILAIEDDQVVGFSWGAVWTTAELNDELGLSLPITKTNTLGYIKDIGVTAAYRQQGIAQTLLRELLCVLQQSCTQDEWFYARTLAFHEPSIVYSWFPKLGFTHIAQYPQDSPRAGQVILGCQFRSL